MEILLHKVAAVAQSWTILCKIEYQPILKEKVAEIQGTAFYGDVASELILAWDLRWKQDPSLEFSPVSCGPFQSDNLVCRYSRKSQAVG
jgi:hypothetical protein